MSIKVFIDGSSGTTGLRIADRLAARPEIELLSISAEGRKDVNERAKVINSADLAFLCLPDAASREVIPLVDEKVKILDTSTAFRTAPGWVYGFPELRGQREKIKTANRVAVPGCHASGFISLARPLVELGLVPADYPFTCHSLTGYSGGGKKMIGEYEAEDRPRTYDAPRAYGLNLHHKHLPEMQVVSGLTAPPIFCPIVDDYYSGMEVTVPLRMELLNGVTPAQIAEGLAAYYAGEGQITVHPLGEVPADGMISGNELQGTDRMELYCTASPDGTQMLLISLFDNLGKGSSGAAVQCMNILLGLEETAGLE
ncbi:N-acetyl-gamma-glutamyl-phosphate reductase [Faecalibacterium gallinarum]|uniref:N-acetyl-gamma-glutamyl-phosphate reductase n=1 Tax=Faecalibacterium gallinarum TaxID=2903556 RepID=A0AA37MYU8_9FIRM|nr:N-acetyl-gamma-glutamyl-phosphate reductase [Faecalibacterium gallinarum]GJN64243.1 N-acetyl-gamma-glutamyl-phosphate reductase [Faecalibacterium gallinarum]